MNQQVVVIDKPLNEEVPDDTSKLPRLEGWTEHPHQLSGTVYSHPRCLDGEYVWTSELIWLRRDLGIAQTRNTLYALVKEAL